eukprot:Pgem_evm1s20103
MVSSGSIVYNNKELRRRIFSYLFNDLEQVKKQNAWWVLYYQKYPKSMETASKEGQLQIVKYLHKHLQVKCTNDAMLNAVEQGYLDIVKYLYEIGGVSYLFDDTMFPDASEFFIYFMQENFNLIDCAIKSGHLDIVKYIYTKMKHPFSDLSLSYASEHGLDKYSEKTFGKSFSEVAISNNLLLKGIKKVQLSGNSEFRFCNVDKYLNALNDIDNEVNSWDLTKAFSGE